MDSVNREERMLAARNERPSVSLRIPFVEFVGLTAALMALTALSIDIMLPALPQIGSALGVTSENDRQLIIILYMAGFAARANFLRSTFRSFWPKTRAALGTCDFHRRFTGSPAGGIFHDASRGSARSGCWRRFTPRSSQSPSSAISTAAGKWRASCHLP